MPYVMEIVCNACYSDPAFYRLLNTKERFDLIVIDSFTSECNVHVAPLVTHFKAPFIYIGGLPPSVYKN